MYAYFVFTDESAPSLSVASRGAAPARRASRASDASIDATPTSAAAPALSESVAPVEPPGSAIEGAVVPSPVPSPAPRVVEAPASAALVAATPLAPVSAAPPPLLEVASLGALPAAAVVATAAPMVVAVPVLTLSDRERGLVGAMNVRRAAAGLAPLEVADALTATSRTRSADMLANNYFAHSSPTGQTWYSLLTARGLTYSAGGENLAKVSGDAATAVVVAIDALMASPTHRANILNAAFRRVGVGASSQGDALTIFTTVFTDR